MVKVKGSITPLEMFIIGSIKDVSAKNIEFKNITFDVETIRDAADNVFAKRKKGSWIPCNNGKFTGGAYWFSCSKCGHIVPGGLQSGKIFCEACGADMR